MGYICTDFYTQFRLKYQQHNACWDVNCFQMCIWASLERKTLMVLKLMAVRTQKVSCCVSQKL